MDSSIGGATAKGAGMHELVEGYDSHRRYGEALNLANGERHWEARHSPHGDCALQVRPLYHAVDVLGCDEGQA